MELVHVEVEPPPRHRDDQAEPVDDLGGGDRHHGQRKDLPVSAAVVSCEGDQGQVRTVEHDLEREQDDQRAPANQDAEVACAEQEGGDAEVPDDVGADHCSTLDSLEWLPRITPPTAAIRSTMD